MSFKQKIGGLVLLIASLVFCFTEADGLGDFYIFMSASSQIDGHTDIYSYGFLVDYHYYYSVLFALLLKPLGSLPFFWVKFYWLLFNMGLYFHLLWLLSQNALVKGMSLKQQRYFILIVFIFSFRFLRENIHVSQITILILWCCIAGLRNIHQGKNLRGSLLLAIGLNIKLLPIVLLPYLLYRGFFRAFAFVVVFYSISMLAPGFVIGHDYNLYLLKCWFRLINPTNTHHVLDVDERSFHSLTTLLSTLLVEKVPDYYAMHLKRNIANVSIETLASVILYTRLVLAAFTLYFLRTWPFKKAAGETHILFEISYILLLVPLIFPHQQHYAFLFIVPAFACVLYVIFTGTKTLSKYKRALLIGLLSIVALCGNLKIWLGEFNHYYEHFKILTYGALLLIPLLAWAFARNYRHSVQN